jgi:hypothetical protein
MRIRIVPETCRPPRPHATGAFSSLIGGCLIRTDPPRGRPSVTADPARRDGGSCGAAGIGRLIRACRRALPLSGTGPSSARNLDFRGHPRLSKSRVNPRGAGYDHPGRCEALGNLGPPRAARGVSFPAPFTACGRSPHQKIALAQISDQIFVASVLNKAVGPFWRRR